MKPVFLLGLGCQKGGTSWMHDHLSRLQGSDFGNGKEYHVLDAMFVPKMNKSFTENLRNLEERASMWRLREDRRVRLNALRRRARLVESIDAYAAHFDGLREANPDLTLTGDVTPSYALLDAAALGAARDAVEAQGFEMRAVFLMRDPVERLHSQARMKASKMTPVGNVVKMAREVMADPLKRARSLYAPTLAAMNEVFPPDRRLVMLSAHLRTVEGVRALTRFLGAPETPPDFSRSFSSPANAPLPAPLIARARAAFASSYDVAVAMFGREEIARSWPYLDVRSGPRTSS